MGIEALPPELIAASAGVDGAQSQDVFGPGPSPEPARLFAAGADDGLAASLDDARADKEALAPEGPLLHSFHIVNKVRQRLLDLLGLRLTGAFGAGLLNEVLDAVTQ